MENTSKQRNSNREASKLTMQEIDSVVKKSSKHVKSDDAIKQ